MKEKNKMRKILLTIMLAVASITAVLGTSSQAALQSNSTTHNKNRADYELKERVSMDSGN